MGRMTERQAVLPVNAPDGPWVSYDTIPEADMRVTSRVRSGVFSLVMLAAILMSGCAAFSAKQSETPLEIANISIESINSSTVRIDWNTNKETLGGVYLVKRDQETLTPESPPQRSKSHSVTIGGMSPGTDYVFEIGAEFYGPDGFSEQYVHQRVVFKMP